MDQPDHYGDLDAVEAAAWSMLQEGARQRRHAFHQATVGTVRLDNLPSVRTVVLRAADPDARTLRFHTDNRSRKYAELKHQPACVLHFYDHDAKIQIRAEGVAALHDGTSQAAERWAAMRDMSKACYRQPKGPGTALGGPAGAEEDGLLADADGYANFVVVEVALASLEWLYLAAKGHRRALIDYRCGSRHWLAP